MTVAKEVSVLILEAELQTAKRMGAGYGWEFTDLDPNGPSFSVKIQSVVDNEQYIMEFQCDDYKEKPPYIEFKHPSTGEKGTRVCYPSDSQPDGSIFHDLPCICNPCSRKAYGHRGGPHPEWDPNIGNWINMMGPTTIGEITLMVQARINSKDKYRGRKH